MSKFTAFLGALIFSLTLSTSANAGGLLFVALAKFTIHATAPQTVTVAEQTIAQPAASDAITVAVETVAGTTSQDTAATEPKSDGKPDKVGPEQHDSAHVSDKSEEPATPSESESTPATKPDSQNTGEPGTTKTERPQFQGLAALIARMHQSATPTVPKIGVPGLPIPMHGATTAMLDRAQAATTNASFRSAIAAPANGVKTGKGAGLLKVLSLFGH